MMGHRYDREARKESLREEAPTYIDGNGDEVPFNGIDYVEVYAGSVEGVDPSLDRRLLLVHFIFELKLDIAPSNVVIRGGDRVRDVNIAEVHVPPQGHAGQPSGWTGEVEKLLFDGSDERWDHIDLGRLMVVETEESGDFSTYRLKLVTAGEAEARLRGVDRVLAEAPINFKVGCRRDVDCRPEGASVEEAYDEPRINYLAKDYASFRRLMLDRLSTTMPEWRDRTPADLGVTLVEMMAYAADQLSYYQDAVATESYLGTARQRTSVRRHARLLDYQMHDGCSARAWVSLELAAGSSPQVIGPASLEDEPYRFLTSTPNATSVVDAEDFEATVRRHEPEVFELVEPAYLDPAHYEMSIHDWDDPDFRLHAGATSATLAAPKDALNLAPGDVIIFEQVREPGLGPGVAEASLRHAVRLTSVDPAPRFDEDGVGRVRGAQQAPQHVDPVTDDWLVDVTWGEQDALPFDLVVAAEFGGEVHRELAVARGNVVLVEHGRSIGPERLNRRGRLPERPALEEGPVAQSMPATRRTGSAAAAMTTDPTVAAPAVELSEREGGLTWSVQPDLLESDSLARHFAVEVESDETARIRFGDDVNGRQPHPTEPIDAHYRVGAGTSGNVPAEAIRHVVLGEADVLDVVGVRNPLPATGGEEPESVERVRRMAPHQFRRRARAVTAEDYSDLVERHSEVQRARAERRWTGSWHTMFVAVDRVEGRPVDAAFERQIRRHLEQFRIAGDDIEIEPPRFVPLKIQMFVCVAEGYYRDEVRRALRRRFTSGRRPGGEAGFFHPDRWTFGDSLYLSAVVAEAMDVTGVDWVSLDPGDRTSVAFRRLHEPASMSAKRHDAGRIPIGRNEILRLANDPDHPDWGSIAFTMQGGS